MKILFVFKGTLDRPESADAHYFQISLAKLGFSVSTIARAGGDSGSLVAAGVRVIEVGKDQEWLTALKKAAHSVQPDIVHVIRHTGCGFCPLLMRSNPRPSFVLDIRSPLLRTGLLRYLIRLKNGLEVLGYNAIAAHSVESAWTVIGRRRWIHLVPPGVDLTAIPVSAERKAPMSPLRLVYIGSLAKSRKVLQMVSAVLIAARNLPLTLDIYGNGEDKETIKAMLRRESNGQMVQLRGTIAREELYARLVQYDIGLSYVPRKFYDPAPPLKTLEYLASGLPTVATNTKGNALFIRDGENGLLVDEAPSSFSEGILRLAGNRALRTKFARVARESVVKYDWKHIVRERLLPVYEELLGRIE